MPPGEQSHNEKYFVNQRLKFYVVGIKEGARGEEIIVSRSANGLLEGLFRQEVPEITQGTVEVKTIAREGGSRSKIAVSSNQAGVDPVGSCVGQKGVRVQAVINELGDEKIDVISYQEDPVEFIKAALSPAKDLQVKIDEKEKTAEVTTPDDQLSLAIGKEGQNVRLAAKLTGYKIDIRGKSGTPKEVEAKEKALQEEAKRALGVTDDAAKEEKAAETVSETPKAGNQQAAAAQQASDQPSDQPTDDTQITPPADDAEPLISDEQEKADEQASDEVSSKISEAGVPSDQTEEPKEEPQPQVEQTEQTSQVDTQVESPTEDSEEPAK